ncbi:MAG: hypothetical protein PSX80_01880 [bacterium]|nr:hypothetical protein [bacterium]
MRPANATKANLGLSDRLSVKLLALFAATFVIGFLALWAYGVSASYLESSLAEAAAPQAPQPVVIDPNLRNELSQVMTMSDATAEQAAIKDPFNDRTGLAGLNAVQRSVGGTVTTSGGGGGTTGGGSTAIVTGTNGPGGSGGGSRGGSPSGTSAPPVLPATEATKLRWVAYQQRAAMGDIPLDPRVFAVDDLLPVGVVDGGNGQQEVLFYSEAAARTFSFPIGTMFNDGWLSELRPEGVVFAMNDDRRSAKLRSWTRSLRSIG